MGRCEVCGASTDGSSMTVEIDGAVMAVCPRCARLGKQVKTHTRPTGVHLPPTRTYARESSSLDAESELAIKEDFASQIRNAREAMSLTQEQLGMKVNEKESVISKLETGRLKPSIPLARKLEHLMKISLVEDGASQDG